MRDIATNGLDLVLLLLLRIGEFQFDTRFLGRFLDRYGVGRTPFAFGADLGEAQRDFLVGSKRRHRNRTRDNANDQSGQQISS